MPNDGELVRQVLNGSRDVYAELVRRYERPVFAAAASVVRNWHDVQDISQEAFLSAYQRLGTLKDPQAFGAWIVRIARTQALKTLRKTQRQAAWDRVPEDPDETQDSRVEERTEEILSVVMQLPEALLQVVLLRYFQDLSVTDIAEATNQPIGTVTSQLCRARQAIRIRMNEGRS